MNIKKGQIMWLSKYALSRGIYSVEASGPLIEDKYVSVKESYNLHILGKEIHTSSSDAIKAAEAARIEKIASLRKKINRLEQMTFDEAP